MSVTLNAPPTRNQRLLRWVNEMVALCEPDSVHWFEGTDEEYELLSKQLVEAGTLRRARSGQAPRLVLGGVGSERRRPGRGPDVHLLRTRGRRRADQQLGGPGGDAGPPPTSCSAGSMRGRTMYVVPFSMGPLGSPLSYIGVEITDSPYVAAEHAHHDPGRHARPRRARRRASSCRACTRSARRSSRARPTSPWPCNPDEKWIVHFPETREIWSYGSGYGGNALLGKKCFALRIASVIARDEGWLAEHMLILKLTNPEGVSRYIAAAFPSACGKTNLAMLIPSIPGWKAETIGDDIAWMKFGDDGRLYAINPEFGFFGVAPGTNMETNPNAMRPLTKQHRVHERRAHRRRRRLVGGHGRPSRRRTAPTGSATTGRRSRRRPPRIPNSRFCAPASQCPVIADEWEDPKGVPISAFLFGGRRATTVPLVFEARDWRHGVFIGADHGLGEDRGRVRRARRSCAATRSRCCRSAATTWPTTSPTGCA